MLLLLHHSRMDLLMELVHHGLLDVVQDQLLREVTFWSCLVNVNLGLESDNRVLKLLSLISHQ